MWNKATTGMAAQGPSSPGAVSGPGGGATGWHPTILYLLVLVVVELVVVAFITRKFLT